MEGGLRALAVALVVMAILVAVQATREQAAGPPPSPEAEADGEGSLAAAPTATLRWDAWELTNDGPAVLVCFENGLLGAASREDDLELVDEREDATTDCDWRIRRRPSPD